MDAGIHIALRGVVAATLFVAFFAGCRESAREAERPASCPATRPAALPLANVRPEHETLEYWLARQEAHGALDEPMLDEAAVRRHNAALRRAADGEAPARSDLREPIDPDVLGAQIDERLAYMRARLDAGDLVTADGDALGDTSAFAARATLEPVQEWRRVERLTPLRCGPYPEGLYAPPVDADFDRNRCSTMREGELVELVGRWPNGMWLGRTGYALGWVDGAGLSGALEAARVEALVAGAEATPLTRRALLTEAFSFLGEPYGWGGKDGGYDCSRFLLELLGRFGVELPRHSARQARAGTFSVDVSSVEDPGEKQLLLEAAARRGVTLLHFPGHIMLYLGQTEEGVPMAIHAFSEFVTPCEGTELETVNRLDRVAVSDLSLGEGSSRRDFLGRVTRVTIIGAPPGPALVADAELRPSAPVDPPEGHCPDASGAALFQSPRRPSSAQPLRVIATGERDPGPASLVLVSPDGAAHAPTEHVLDGPPFSRWVEIAEPQPGRWTAMLADGDRVLACKRFAVSPKPTPTAPRARPGPAWKVERRWARDTENLYAAFVEQLFREPSGEDVTWSNLQEVVGDRERNLLYDYSAQGEDARLALEPDCADLPYFLRAYFAWKLRLPFVYRACTRGRKDQPPTCEPYVFSNLEPVPGADEPGAFRRFTRRLAGTVHSSSPRTVPSDDETDLYPLRVSRRALRPGTVFADPYGHVLVVARWKPQSALDYGVLVGADAQPDGTVGRRRFWRGSFLFTPETEVVGAGFKGWRPVRYDPTRIESPAEPSDEPPAEPTEMAPSETEPSETEPSEPPPPPQPWAIATNDALRKAGARSWSDAQYRGSSDDFYAAVEGLINPRPLDPIRRQVSLVDALEESVQRRLSSVDNGEQFMKERSFAPIDMPRGSALFLTTGPWEDYSTPSRDMRLLISFDAVLSFPDTVAAHPERFGVREADSSMAAARVREALENELSRRQFEYTRSDGSTTTLTLKDLVDRRRAMEVAYNPNDCVELRWGAPEGSDERATCKRRAPADQQARMKKYRPWFAKRERP